MNATVDADLLKLVQQHVNALNTDVGKLTFEVQEDKKRVSQALKYISTSLEELRARVASVQHEQEVMKQEQSSLTDKMDNLETDMDSTHEQLKSLKCQQEDVQQRVAHVEEKLNSAFENRGKVKVYTIGIICFCIYENSENRKLARSTVFCFYFARSRSKIDDKLTQMNVSFVLLHSLTFLLVLFSLFFPSLGVILRPLGLVKSKCLGVIWCKVLTRFSKIQSYTCTSYGVNVS